jgi:glycosyltransferase involved in cell wall biosynthesis
MSALGAADAPAGGRRVSVDVVVPVYNEERDLETSVRRLRSFLDGSIPFDTVVTIADNASTDRTWAVASRLAAELPGVRAMHLDAKGRGRALRAAWSGSDADVVAYMDVDLSTDLHALLPLLAPVVSGHSDVAIGSRLARGARVVRGPKRELISRSYNLLLRLALRNRFSDAQCGFKAMRADEARALLPAIVDEEWFFDTELLVLAERNGLRIHEVPVDWIDDPDTRVRIVHTAVGDLKGVVRLLRGFAARGDRVDGLHARDSEEELAEVARFARVGVLSTLAYIAAYLALRHRLGDELANLASLAACTAGNVAAHARYTFRRRGPIARRACALGAASTLATSAVLTTAALFGARAVLGSSPLVQGAALLVGTAAAALVRFALLKALLVRGHARRAVETGAGETGAGAPPPLGGGSGATVR